MEQQGEERHVLDVSGLARVLGRTEASIRAAVYRGTGLPPRLDGRRLLWNAEVVERWIKAKDSPRSGA